MSYLMLWHLNLGIGSQNRYVILLFINLLVFLPGLYFKSSISCTLSAYASLRLSVYYALSLLIFHLITYPLKSCAGLMHLAVLLSSEARF
jgi:hypothetical protein